jgi:glycosyltransferase involved in cell wall biosynthesis
VGKRLLFIVNELHFFVSHRLPLALAARDAGYEVHVATRPGDGTVPIESLGLVHHAIRLSRSGRNPLAELLAVWRLTRLLRSVRPDVLHLVTIKPVLYGGLAAKLARTHGIVAAVSGLGFVFTSERAGARVLLGLVKGLYRLALGHRNLRVIFQNPADMSLLIDQGIVARDKALLLPGSGVDLSEYQAQPEIDGEQVVVMAARLLKDKGVGEFVEAARRLRRDGMRARFLLVGEPDPGNPQSVTVRDLQVWRAAGDVELLGFRRDIAKLFSASHVVVLPSYREGLPKVLIEAAACGRAVVTTDSPGCRDAIEPGITGLLVPVKDVDALVHAIRRLIDDSALRRRMGQAGRQLAERRYSIERIVNAHLAIYAEVSRRE